jgi:hypothetical protein
LCARRCRQLLGEAGLADAGLALQDQGLHGRLVERIEHAAELVGPSHQRYGRLGPGYRCGCRRHRFGRWRWGGDGHLEGRIVIEDRGLEVLQWASGIDSQLVAQHPAGVVDGAESVCLPARTVQGQSQTAAQALPERVCTN